MTNSLTSYFCNKCGRRVLAGVALDHTIQFHCTKCGNSPTANKVTWYIQDKQEDKNMRDMNGDAENLRAFIHGLWAQAVQKDKSKAWSILCAARRAYKMKSIPLWRGALDAMEKLANS